VLVSTRPGEAEYARGRRGTVGGMADRWKNRNRGLDVAPTGMTGAGVIAGLTGCLGIGAVIAFVIIGAAALFLRACGDVELGIDDPGDGTKSERVAVVVTPRTNLRADQVVQVRSEAFEANAIVGITQCLPSADTESAGERACDVDGGSRFAVRPDGKLDAPFPIRRVITVGGDAHDCAIVEGGCLVVAAAATDFDRSGGQRITFATGLGPVVPEPISGRAASLRLPVTTDPVAPYRDGQTITLSAEGFVPDEPLLLAWCTEAFDRDGPVGACEAEDVAQAYGPIIRGSVEGVTRRADAMGKVELEVAIKASIRPTVGFGGEGTPSRCTAASPCRAVIAAAADTQRSAVVEYSIPA
jgi:hypothetical protein